MWTRGLAVLMLLAIVVVAIAGMRDTPVRRALVPDGPTEVERALDRPLPNFSLDAVPLEEAIVRLKQAGGVEIVLDRKALETAGIDPRTPVTVPPLPKYTLSRVLVTALESASTSTARLGFTPREDHLFVSTGDALAPEVRIRVYDLRDLVATQKELPYFRSAPTFGPAGGMPSGQGLFGGARPQTWIEELVSLVTETVAPDSWRDAGGSVGSIREMGGRVVIAQTWENHQAIRRLLEELRQPSPPMPPPAVNHVWNDQLQRWLRDPQPKDPELALLKTLPADARVDASSLSAALNSLAKASGVEILLDEQLLAAAGPDTDRPLGVREPVGGQTLARALDRVLTGAGNPPLGYTLQEEGILVTRREQADGVGITRSYDVRDLLLRAAPASPPADVDFRGAESDARELAIESIGQAIRDGVDPGSWRDNGGNLGTIRDLAGFLLITQNLKNHAGVARTLAGLRAGPPTTRPATAPAEAAE